MNDRNVMVTYISLYGLSQYAMILGLGLVIRHMSYSSFDTWNSDKTRFNQRSQVLETLSRNIVIYNQNKRARLRRMVWPGAENRFLGCWTHNKVFFYLSLSFPRSFWQTNNTIYHLLWIYDPKFSKFHFIVV